MNGQERFTMAYHGLDSIDRSVWVTGLGLLGALVLLMGILCLPLMVRNHRELNERIALLCAARDANRAGIRADYARMSLDEKRTAYRCASPEERVVIASALDPNSANEFLSLAGPA
ncbi:Uncharacterised protein [Mycobacteroides abscessus subsp. abscessus]|nr:Uncharacterised protein [Mycobacteroides abscessus subsp. abscessus]